jgi:hypothetical protein
MVTITASATSLSVVEESKELTNLAKKPATVLEEILLTIS